MLTFLKIKKKVFKNYENLLYDSCVMTTTEIMLLVFFYTLRVREDLPPDFNR